LNHVLRFCKVEEISLVQFFIKENWKKDHIFVEDTKLLRWQHHDQINNRLNFVVAFNTETKEFDAILGFIPTTQFDHEIKTNDIWLAIWKVKESYASSGIGLQLFLFLTSYYNANSMGVIGISDDANKIYKAFRYKSGSLSHYYIKNDRIKNFSISSFETSDPTSITNDASYHIRKISTHDFKNSKLQVHFIPKKTKRYFINRYSNHPTYKYDFWGIYDSNSLVSSFISRTIVIETHTIIRIVDWMGEFTSNLYNEIQELLQNNRAEYIDMLCYIPDEQQVLGMGFSKKHGKDVIPNYFEPFNKSNVDIKFAYKTRTHRYSFFKGDSDQDRPNIFGSK
jgi:hypothetical protein